MTGKVLHPSDELRMAAERLLDTETCIKVGGPDCDCELAKALAVHFSQLADDWDADPDRHGADDCDDVYLFGLEAARRINALTAEVGQS